jgi:Flp pilus assembly protein TadG
LEVHFDAVHAWRLPENKFRLMKLLGIRRCVAKRVLLIGLASAMGAGSLFAQIYTDTLADLAAHGGSLSIGDKTFSGFSYLATSDLTSFDPTQITVTASIGSDGTYYLTWSGNIALATFATATADLKLNYIVMASGGSISMIDQAYTGSAQPAGSTFLAVDETVSTGSFGGTIVGQSHLTAYDVTDPPAESNDELNIVPPQTLLYVTKDIALAAISPPAGFVTISQVTQSFHQVPEPGTLLLGSLGSGLLLLLRSRRQA